MVKAIGSDSAEDLGQLSDEELMGRYREDRTAELRHQALHDALTGLPNRLLIADRLERLLARGRRNGLPGTVLFVDLDDFKDVNDTFGHEAGDQVLQAVATRLSENLREVDTVGRLGGDEFVVLVDGESESPPELVAERIVAILREPLELAGGSSTITVTTSVGAAVGVGYDAGELMRDADMALYRAKATGKNRSEIAQLSSKTPDAPDAPDAGPPAGSDPRPPDAPDSRPLAGAI